MIERVSVDLPAEISFEQIQQWAQQFEHCSIFNSYSDIYETAYPGGTKYDWVIAAQSIADIVGDNISELRSFYKQQTDWIFGALSYDLKNTLEKVESANTDGLQQPNIAFFVPQYLFVSENGHARLLIRNESDVSVFEEIRSTKAYQIKPFEVNLKARIDRATYLKQVEQCQDYIQRGDIYEANFCQEFYQENAAIDLFGVYQRLTDISQTPFSSFVRFKQWQTAGASPERYLQKKGKTILSQPIKGTAKRGATTQEDQAHIEYLKNSTKEKAENVMIVDLVRNDLSRTASKNSVEVTDLCGIYAFPQVHQMISTIESKVKDGLDIFDVIETTFPMGSMTGAPKISAMNICEELESFKRGWYSGSFGYIDPNGDADFNVVIRSIHYNASTQYLSYAVGGAITILANAGEEYDECLLKAKAIQEVLGNYPEKTGL